MEETWKLMLWLPHSIRLLSVWNIYSWMKFTCKRDSCPSCLLYFFSLLFFSQSLILYSHFITSTLLFLSLAFFFYWKKYSIVKFFMLLYIETLSIVKSLNIYKQNNNRIYIICNIYIYILFPSLLISFL